MTNEELYYLAYLKEECKSLKRFCEIFWPVVKPGKKFISTWFTDCLFEHLHLLETGEIKNLLLSTPPGTGKSTLINCYFFAHLWTKNPSLKALFASYDLNLAERDSSFCRLIIESELYQQLWGQDINIDTDQNTKTHFRNTKMGSRQTTSIGSTGTGLRVDVSCIDDPLRVTKQNSIYSVEQVVSWHDSEFFTRVSGEGGFRICMHQRISVNDLTSHLLKSGVWCHCSIPWNWTGRKRITKFFNDPRTKRGTPLLPELYDETYIDDVKRTLGKAQFSAQYQQEPYENEYSLIKESDLVYYTATKDAYLVDGRETSRDKTIRLMAVDPSGSEHKGDFTAILVADIGYQGQIFIVHASHCQVGLLRVMEKIEETYHAYKPDYILVEQAGVMNFFEEEGLRLSLPIRKLKPVDSKAERARPLIISVENHNFALPKDATYTDELLKQLIAFPNSQIKNDYVDAAAWLATEVRRITRDSKPIEPEKQLTPEEQQAKRFQEMICAD